MSLEKELNALKQQLLDKVAHIDALLERREAYEQPQVTEIVLAKAGKAPARKKRTGKAETAILSLFNGEPIARKDVIKRAKKVHVTAGNAVSVLAQLQSKGLIKQSASGWGKTAYIKA